MESSEKLPESGTPVAIENLSPTTIAQPKLIVDVAGGFNTLAEAQAYFVADYDQVQLTKDGCNDHGMLAWRLKTRVVGKKHSAFDDVDVVIHKHKGNNHVDVYSFVKALVVVTVDEKDTACVLSIGKHSYHTFQVMIQKLDATTYEPLSGDLELVDILRLSNDMKSLVQLQNGHVVLQSSYEYIAKKVEEEFATKTTSKNNNNSDRELRPRKVAEANVSAKSAVAGEKKKKKKGKRAVAPRANQSSGKSARATPPRQKAKPIENVAESDSSSTSSLSSETSEKVRVVKDKKRKKGQEEDESDESSCSADLAIIDRMQLIILEGMKLDRLVEHAEHRKERKHRKGS